MRIENIKLQNNKILKWHVSLFGRMRMSRQTDFLGWSLTFDLRKTLAACSDLGW